jgi:iron(III) transport system substrate-binding protein
MTSRRYFTLAGLAWTATGCDPLPEFASRPGPAAADSSLKAAATREGALRVDAVIEQHGVADFLDSFRRLYPGIALEYHRPFSSELHPTYMQDVAAGRPTADILISSAMDLQFKFVNDGLAQAYESPEKPHLPDWAVWKDQAYAVTAEPIVFAYNRALMPAADVPHSHFELADLLRRKPDEYRGKIATYDPERSATGYLYYTQDLLLSHDTLDLVQAAGRARPCFYVSGVDALNKLAGGEHLLAYNMVSSYMIHRQLQDPNIGIIFPNDYTLVMSRVAVIPKTAGHPAAARVFLDFLLSALGQTLLARRHMQPIRIGVPMDGAAPSPEVLRPIHFGPSLLANLDDFRRRRVLREWRHTFES